MSDDDRPIDRSALIEEFGEQEVERQEWWADEMDRVGGVRDDILAAVRERDDVQLMKTGTSTSRDGRHEATFRLRIAGEPWDGESDGE